jgi:uncharacterized protein YndB with AHSA1/START domain
MPRVTRRRTLAASPAEVWEVISDPYNLPRWWPRTVRVENVERTKAGRRSHWTTVMEGRDGRGIRADFRCISSAAAERFVWEQEIEGSPFERVLRTAVLEIELEPEGDWTEVTLTSRQGLRGLSRLGSPLMRSGTGRILDEALDGLERALGAPQGARSPEKGD